MLLLLAIATLGALNVGIAPDQPLDQVYVNEPLILKLHADEQTVVEGRVDLVSETGSTEQVAIKPIVLAPGQTHWRPLGIVAQGRGNYVARVTLNGVETSLPFCRVDRPVQGLKAPYYVHAEAFPRDLRLALEGVCATRLRFDVGRPDAEEQLRQAEDAGFSVILSADVPTLLADTKRTEEIATQFRDRLVRWEIAPGEDANALAQAIELVRRSGSRLPVGLVVHSAEQARAALTDGAGRLVSLLVLDTPGLAATELRDAAEETGHENLPVYVRLDTTTEHLQEAYLAALADGARRVELPAGSLLNASGSLAAAYPYLSALTARLSGAAYFGTLHRSGGAHAVLFRNGTEWLLACWGEGTSLDIPYDASASLSGFDALNNATPLPEPAGNAIHLPLQASPQFLVGTDYDVIAMVARTMAQHEAARFKDSVAYGQELFPDVNEVVATLAKGSTQSTPRLDFFTVLRALPVLEQRCHDGSLSPAIAVPAIASLTRLARQLCVLEQARGEAFLEPFPETLAKCSDYKSHYLTGTGSGARVLSRGDWILQEVNRLVAEARALSEAGNTIEASAVATLGEWRARGLEAVSGTAPGYAPFAGESAAPWQSRSNATSTTEPETEDEGYVP